MRPPSKKQAAAEIAHRLTEILGRSPRTIRRLPRTTADDYFMIAVAGKRFIVEYTKLATAGPLANKVERLKQSTHERPQYGAPLIVVPFMGQVGRRICDSAGVAWMDLSGNAKIVAPGLRIVIEGRPNPFGERGRPPNVFAKRSSRVARQLLLQPREFRTQACLARLTGLGDGYVSRIVRRLQEEHYIEVNDEGAVRPRDPNLMLDAWRHAYDFGRHNVIQGHVPARSGDELLQKLATHLSREGVEHAATGLAAAWLFTHFASFRLVTFYVSSMPSRSLLKQLEFADEPQGANCWLVLPNDDGVFQGSESPGGIPCVSPVQTYLDLKGQPERAPDAAAELRRIKLAWGRDER